MDILQKILATKAEEVAESQRKVSLASLQTTVRKSQEAVRGFARALRQASFPAIIAEIKRASPSRGVLRADLDPVAIARMYAENGATCLSVLTDKQYFQGQLSYLQDIRQNVPVVPLLRKDFIIDEYQVWESRLAGADAILLIVSALRDEQLLFLQQLAFDLSLDVLVEVHDVAEARRVFDMLEQQPQGSVDGPSVIFGVNNRNLRTFAIDLAVTEEVLREARRWVTTNVSRESLSRELLFMSESGIFTGSDIQRLSRSGANGFLIGESLVAKGDPGKNLSDLCQAAHAEQN